MNSSSNPPSAGETRRTFIRKAAQTAAVVSASGLVGCATKKTATAKSAPAPFIGRVIGANDRIVVAFIGAGKQGSTHIRANKDYASDNNIAFGAVCDLYQKHLDAAKKT